MPKIKITGLPQMKNGGYTVKRSNARKGKTHVVTGPDGTKKYFGDPTMGEKGNSKNGKKAFYARHKHNLKNNPYFRAYARATWADGGIVDMYEGGGEVTPMYNPAVPEVSVFDLTKQAMGGLIYKMGGPIKAGEGYVQNEPSDGFAYGGMYATSDSPVPQRTSGLMNYLGYAQGGTKLPTPILRARLEAHMSPEEANDYIANYADGGNTGTGILGNMTFNPQPWKYVAGGQLGPYPSPSYKTDLSEFKKGGIYIKPEKRGTFTAAATKHGMGVQEFARKVMANKENYSPAMVKKANFARNAAKWKHAYGGTQPDLPKFYPGGPFGTLSDPNNPLLKGAQQAINDNTYTNQTDFFSRNAAPINQVPSSVSGPMSLPDKTVIYPNNQGTKTSPNLYYPGQFLSQSLGEISYLGEQGKGYETDPEYTYTPELMSAKTPIDAINESGRLAAANLRTGSGGAGNIYLANMAGLGTNLARTKASTIEGIQAANLERMNQARLMNLQAKQASDLQTAQNRAQALQNYYATIGSLGMKGAVTGKDVRSEQMDKYKWQYLPQMFRAIEKNPELYKMIMKEV